MNKPIMPKLVEAFELELHLNNPDVVIVDLCRSEVYAQLHIPGALHINYQSIVASQSPVMGLLPDKHHLCEVMSSIGADTTKHIVAYDDEGGGKAARWLYTLDVLNHKHTSLLNGGIHAWTSEQYLVQSTLNNATPTAYDCVLNTLPIADREFILQNLHNANVALVDARSAEEFSGEKRLAQRGGHIPGAKHIDWLRLMDKHKHFRLKSSAELESIFAEQRVSRDKTVITYCQTHHRSALVYIALQILGFPDVKAYPGSWSEWGNSIDTPIEEN